MKIIITASAYPEGKGIGGAEKQANLLAEHMMAGGHETVFMALRGDKSGLSKSATDLPIYTVGPWNKNTWRYFFSILKFVRQHRPDVWYVRDFTFLSLMVIIAKILRIPIVYNTTHIHNCSPTMHIKPKKYLARLKMTIKQWLNFHALRFVNVITINKLHVKILDKYKIKGHCIYNSMADDYQNNKTDKDKAVVWVANIKPRKRPELFIDLANKCKDSGYKFLMIGNIQSKSDYYQKKLAETQKNNSNFIYLGGRNFSEVDKVLARSMIMINTCEPEGFGNNFIQAWLNECPTITLGFDPDDIIVNEKIGFHSGNFEQLKKDLILLMNNTEKREEMGKRARVYACDNHLMKINGPKYEQFFKKLLK